MMEGVGCSIYMHNHVYALGPFPPGINWNEY